MASPRIPAVIWYYMGMGMPLVLHAQTVLRSPAEARSRADIDYANVRWVAWVSPKYKVSGFDRRFLDSNFFQVKDHRLVEQVVFAKINMYRKEMGRPPLQWCQKGADISREYTEKCARRGTIDHELDGTTPTSRMQPGFVERINVAENLHHFGGTITGDTVDAYADYVLWCWINSRPHNTCLLLPSGKACVAFYTLRLPNVEHYTATAFSVIR
ncbi:MAG: hypothetical protein H6595_13025 [Flavobacteriales bacterium]|nr:hypothetical protein [Flavobacteriales bacterium]MCB9168387.1 hypothetical protein [Flavobacteriales bacterium]